MSIQFYLFFISLHNIFKYCSVFFRSGFYGNLILFLWYRENKILHHQDDRICLTYFQALPDNKWVPKFSVLQKLLLALFSFFFLQKHVLVTNICPLHNRLPPFVRQIQHRWRRNISGFKWNHFCFIYSKYNIERLAYCHQ